MRMIPGTVHGRKADTVDWKAVSIGCRVFRVALNVIFTSGGAKPQLLGEAVWRFWHRPIDVSWTCLLQVVVHAH